MGRSEPALACPVLKKGYSIWGGGWGSKYVLSPDRERGLRWETRQGPPSPAPLPSRERGTPYFHRSRVPPDVMGYYGLVIKYLDGHIPIW